MKKLEKGLNELKINFNEEKIEIIIKSIKNNKLLAMINGYTLLIIFSKLSYYMIYN